ncbi:hypothetical protein [Pseudooceanicola marinus]|uniref:hypothetical protein n=1 Tax=Pseudooceanicola marinus TaxID=396013 RepID=UPI00117AA277|nr:hypothetical protein [Pseudooceanicola marinus]
MLHPAGAEVAEEHPVPRRMPLENDVDHGWHYIAVKERAVAGTDISENKAVTGRQVIEMAKKYASDAAQKKASKRAQQKRQRSKDKSGQCETNCETIPASRRPGNERPDNAR